MRRILFAISLILAAPAALAQDTSALSDRLIRLERDVNFLQRQVYRSAGDASSADAGAPAASGSANAQLAVRLAQIEEEMRQMRGALEQSQFTARQNTDALKKLSDDVDYRLQALEQAQSAAATAAPVAEAAPAGEEAPAAEEASAAEPATYQKTAAEEDDAAPAASPTGKDFPDSNAHYNNAFKLMNEKNYSGAAASFDAFVKKYPSDPLTSNAYYWLGESYYARGDFTRAADGFRKGFEVNPQGQKAPDNLLKLAMSLGKVKRANEACIVLKQVASKYADSAPRTAARAMEERSAMQCK